jgi:acetylornithine deacetylase
MDMEEPLELARRLISLDSVNPRLVPGGAGEGAAAAHCAGWLQERGFAVTRLETVAGRPSIVGVATGSGGGRSIMLNGHLDTVGVGTYAGAPLDPVVRDGRVYGRGAFDMKTAVAAILVAAERAVRSGLRGDVIVTLVADEEFGSTGTEEVLRSFTADAAIVAEPSNLEVVLAHRGFAWFELELTGRAAHGSMPHEGVDAIAHAGLVLRALDDVRTGLERMPRHPLLGHGSVRVSTIEGGVDAATVAPSCVLTIERRTLPGETPDSVEAGLRAVLDGIPGIDYALTRLVARGAFEADPEWPIARYLADNAERVLGHRAPVRGEPFWTDAGLVQEAGIPCLLIGVDGGGAHADEEWATLESLTALTSILEGTIRDFCA